MRSRAARRNIYRQVQLNKTDPAARMSGGDVAFMETGIRLMFFCKSATADLLFLLLLQKKKWRVRNDHDGTSRRERRLLSSVLISSFPNRKRCAGLRFGEGISISSQTPLNRPRKPLRFSWIFPARTDGFAPRISFPCTPLLPLPLGEVAERSEVGEGTR